MNKIVPFDEQEILNIQVLDTVTTNYCEIIRVLVNNEPHEVMVSKLGIPDDWILVLPSMGKTYDIRLQEYLKDMGYISRK